MATKIQTFNTVQNGTTLIVPTNGKSLYVWNILIETSSNATVIFDYSSVKLAELLSAGSLGINNLDKQGQTDEEISITCGAGTTVKILYDEV